MLGAFIGDSIGSLHEFGKGELTEEQVDAAMLMPGGGPWHVISGQVTDDSELAMC